MAVRAAKLQKAAQAFLSTGHRDGLDAESLAAECNRLIRLETQQSSEKALKTAHQFIKYARAHEGVLQTTSYRSLGWAHLVAGNYKKAEKTYLRARRLLVRDSMLRARIDRVLIDVYMYLGNSREALRRARMALASFGRLGANAETAMTRVNVANVLHRQDRHRQASRYYEQAVRFFEEQQAEVAVALCSYNLANTLVQLFDFQRARELYTKALNIFQKHRDALHANGCRNGLAWLDMLEGNYHIALQELTLCEKEYAEAGQGREVVLCRLDRAEVYLALNLFIDARNITESAENKARQLRIRYESAKAAFFFAKASFAMGRLSDARAALRRAEKGFKKDDNHAFLAAVKLFSGQMQSGKKIGNHKISAARRRFSQSQLPLWEAICDLQLLADNPENKPALRRLDRNPAVKAVPHLYARHATFLGDRLAARGQLKNAVPYWVKATDVLEAVRAKLPPVDLRSSFSRHAGDPYQRLINTNASSNPVLAATWSERFKTAGLWASVDGAAFADPDRQRAEDSLSELAQHVTALTGMINDLQNQRSLVSLRSNPNVLRLQRKVRRDLAAIERSTGSGPGRTEDIVGLIHKASQQRPVVQFHQGRMDITAFVHYRGETRSHRYVNGCKTAADMVGRWRFLMERAPFVETTSRRSDREDERDLLEQIGAWLWSPLEVPGQQHRVLILPEGHISNLPWHAIINNGKALADVHEITITPSLRHFHHASLQDVRSDRIEVFVGSTEGMASARKELSLLKQCGGRNVVVHDPCTRADWPDSSTARSWHYIGHAVLRSDNPFYSSLVLEDGPLFAADFRIRRNRVGLVTLAGCRTGQQVFPPGEESTGLVRSLLEMGARNVVASHWSVSDRATSIWMTTFFRYLLDGNPVGKAVRYASLSTREKFPSAYHWAAFSVFGAG